ncbi:MAG: nucleotide exchange factor GrpE [Minisyncoccia bacterium]
MNEDDVAVHMDEEDRGAASESEIVEEESRADSKVAKLKEELEKTRKEKQEYMDGWQRSKADYVNALRRFEDEKKTAKQTGIVDAVETLLPAYDALERAKEHGEVPTGFQAIVKQLESAFSSLGLVSVGEVGEAFNPEIHEAFGKDVVGQKEKDDTITAVLEKGWKRGERVIRAAKVRVGEFEG